MVYHIQIYKVKINEINNNMAIQESAYSLEANMCMNYYPTDNWPYKLLDNNWNGYKVRNKYISLKDNFYYVLGIHDTFK